MRVIHRIQKQFPSFSRGAGYTPVRVIHRKLRYMCNPVKDTMFVEGVVESEVVSVVNNCKNKMSTDSFGFDMTTLKNIISYVSKPFTYICNKSFLEGTFPELMKTAKIIPLFKSGDKAKFTNYRPVSLLPQIFKGS